MSCALSITRSVHPPRATYLDWPLGRTSGRPNESDLQRMLVRAALDLVVTATTPGEVRWLDMPWPGGDGWKATAMRSRPRDDDNNNNNNNGGGAGDSRTARSGDPQWQHADDERAWANR